MRTRSLTLILFALPAMLPGQVPAPCPSAADSALAACREAVETPRASAGELASRAEQLWRAEVARHPELPAPRVGLARVLVQCRLVLASGPDETLGLFRAGVAELELALERTPKYWPARLTLALFYSRAPTFLGRTNDAVRQLEQLTSDQGIPAGRIELADALHELAVIYERSGRHAEAAVSRARGRQLLPDDRRFASLDEPAKPPPPEPPLASVAELTVTAASPTSEASRRGRGMSSLEVVTMPGGTADLMQALQGLPGVTGGSESSDLALRGGDPEESPVLLNGARIAYAGKFESLNGGLFGVLDPAVLRSARVHAGGFSVRFGNALSGIIEADAIGRPAVRSRRIAINTAGPSATVMQPFGQNAGAWGSLRAVHTALLLGMHGRRDEYGAAPTSVEGIAGATRLLPAGELAVVALLEHDNAAPRLEVGGYRGDYENSGMTAGTVLSGRFAEVGPLTTLRVNASGTTRGTTTRFGALDFSRRLLRLGARAEGDVLLDATMLLRGGMEASRLRESLDGTVPTTTRFAPDSRVRTLEDVQRSATHLGGFVELLLFPLSGVTLTPGLRVDRLPGERKAAADPRLAAELSAGALTLSLAGGVFRQGRFRPTREQPGLDDRLGVARRARHLVLAAEHRGAVTLRADVYGKRYDRWVGGAPDLMPEDGTVVGGDVFLHLPGEDHSTQLTYSIMRGRLRLPGGATVRSAFDVTHSVVAVTKHRIGDGWQAGATARLATGRPFTAFSAGAAGEDAGLGAPNGDRYPAYARLDTRVSHYARIGRRLLVSYAEVLNLAGRANVVAYGERVDGGDRVPITSFYGQRTMILGAELR